MSAAPAEEVIRRLRNVPKWWKVRVEVWTHKIDGLTESDFILAAKIDEIRKQA